MHWYICMGPVVLLAQFCFREDQAMQGHFGRGVSFLFAADLYRRSAGLHWNLLLTQPCLGESYLHTGRQGPVLLCPCGLEFQNCKDALIHALCAVLAQPCVGEACSC